MEKMIDENKKFIERFKDTKINGFKGFCDEFDAIFEKKIYINEMKREIRIDEEEELDLKYLFDVLNVTLFNMDGRNANKHFNQLQIQNYLLESIKDDVLSEISFDKINIMNCDKLKSIHWNAFGKKAKIVKEINARFLPNLISEPNTDNDLMKFINSLVNCEVIRMETFQSELQPIKLGRLKQLHLNNFNSSTKISSIKGYTFYECDEIELIDLRDNEICFIDENAFHFRNESGKRLRILLNSNNITGSSFALNSLKNIKRATILNLNENKIKYLKEKIIKPFLNANEENQVKIDKNYFNLNDGRNLCYQNDNRYKLIRKLLQRDLIIKMSKNVEHKNSKNPLHLAAEECKPNVAKYPVEHGADISDNNGETPLHRAAEEGRLDVVKYLVELGADIKTRNKDGSTPLHIAVRSGRLDIIIYLVEQGVDIKTPDKDGSTPLHIAVRSGSSDVVKYFVEHGADINISDKDGNTPLHRASLWGRLDIVIYLVEQGADIKTPNKDGSTPIHIVAKSGRLDVVKYFVEHGANINISDKYGNSPIHMFALWSRMDVVKYLVET